MPKRVDHEERRRQIADALLRTAAARGLHATGMREVAAEAGVSLRLVQYYFGTKEELLLFGMQHLAVQFGERAMTRIRRIKEAGGQASPRDVIAAILAEALPADDGRRTFAVLNAAYFALALTDPALAIAPLVKNTNAVIDVIAAQLRTAQAAGDTPAHLEPDAEALSLLAMSAGLGNSVLAGQSSLEQAQAVIDYHLDRLFPAPRPALRPVEPDGGVGGVAGGQARAILAHSAAGTRPPWRSRPSRFFRCLAHLASRSARPLPGAHGSGRLFSWTLIAERSQRSASGSSANRGMTCICGCRTPPWFQPSK